MSLRRLKMSTMGAVVIAATAFGTALPASASLIGDTITIVSQANVPLDIWSDNTIVVGAGIELDGNIGGASPFQHINPTLGQGFAHLFPGDFYDIGASTIHIHYAALPAGGFAYAFQSVFSSLDWLPIAGTLNGVTIAPGAIGLLGSNISNITASGFTFQGTVDLINGADFTLNLAATHNPPAPVPEPASLPILMIGLLGLIAGVRRKRTV